jgi:2-keto-myo-inositol isomerase
MTMADPFGYSMNTSTVGAQKLPLTELVDITAAAGYGAIEPWIAEIEAFAENAPLSDMKKRIADKGLQVTSAIGFAEWIVDDPARRRAGMERMAKDMDSVAAIGGSCIAAPPWGAHETAGPALPVIAERYAALLELGRQHGVTPLIELWGFSKTLNRLGEVAYVATECGDADARLLLDVYHLYKGGSPASGLSVLNGKSIPVFHVNDYPANIPPAKIIDADRVHVGDGIAPLNQIFRTLKAIGFSGWLSVELFNKDYWAQDPLSVAKTALHKVKAAVHRAVG